MLVNTKSPCTKYEWGLLMRLVALDTTSEERRNFDVMANLLVEEAKKIGLSADCVVDENGIPHVVVSLPDAPKMGKKILFVTHYDVVPAGEGWDFDPFKPFIKEGKLFGRGSADDKSNIAAAFAAFKEILDERLPVENNSVLVIAGGEETGHGASFFQRLEGDIGVILDSGCAGLSIGASGVVRLKVKVLGKQAHSAYPFLGRNSIYDAAKIILFVEQFSREIEKRVLSKFNAPSNYDKAPRRINITMINAGVAPNTIPAECTLTIDMRTIPEEDVDAAAMEVKEAIERYAKENDVNVIVEVGEKMKGWYTTDRNVIKFFQRILEEITGKKAKVVVELGATDGIFFIDRMPVIQFGTMRDENNVHGKNEFVYLEDVELVKEFVKRTITSK